jgi:outer membrane protein OmpA-like peptidoglycan-associated protein
MGSLKTILLLMLWLTIHPSFAASPPYIGPEDHRAVEEAVKAVNRLGPERGAIPLVEKVVDIIGLTSISFSGTSVGISKTLQDLGAKKVGTEIQLTLSADILFDFDQWEIKKKAEAVLHQVSKGIIESNKRLIIIEGHTDSKGSEAYNFELSGKRANAVKDWFVSKARLTDIRFQTKGYGESRPIAPNTNPDGSDCADSRAKNRRVEIRISD